LHDATQAKPIIEEIQSAFGYVLAARDGHQRREGPFIPAAEHLSISLRLDEDVPVSEQEIVGTDERLGQLWRFAGAVLDELSAVAEVHAPARAVTEVILDHLRPPARDDEKLAQPGAGQAFDDVLQDRLTLNLEHGLGNLLGEVLHSRALARGEDDGFHGIGLRPRTYRTSLRWPA